MNSRCKKTGIHRSTQRGVSLVEVLVTVAVLSIGLLGIAALQFMSKRSNFDSVERTTATLLANDIIERMRSNAKSLATYAGTFETPNQSLGNGSTVFSSGEPAPNCSTSNPCNKDEMALHDLWAWEQHLLGSTETSGANKTGGLAFPTACVTTNVSNALTDRSGRYTVAIAWRGQTELSDPTNPVASTYDPYGCGRNNGALGTGLYDGTANKNSYRRILFIDTYISAN